MSGWAFPEKQETFRPKGTMFESVFRDPVALIAYAQYRRRHIVSKEENEWLPMFSLTFATCVRQLGRRKISLDTAVKIWTGLWLDNPRGLAPDEGESKFRKMLEPIMPYIRGDWNLRLTEDTLRGKFFLVTEKSEPKLMVLFTVPQHGKSYHHVRCSLCEAEFDVYIWSFHGSGKKCPNCGHSYGTGDLEMPPEEAHAGRMILDYRRIKEYFGLEA